jgi:hypothetical protein
MNQPVVKEHHHEHTTEVVHPSIERQHETVEIQQVVQPIYETVPGQHKEEYHGKKVKTIEKHESEDAARRQMEANRAHLAAQGDVTHSHSHDVRIDATKERDVATGHKVIQEVTPVIHRDVEHEKVIHKDEQVVEKIKHAPQVNTVQGSMPGSTPSF